MWKQAVVSVENVAEFLNSNGLKAEQVFAITLYAQAGEFPISAVLIVWGEENEEKKQKEAYPPREITK